MRGEERLCTAEDSGWRADAIDAAVDFRTRGRDLVVELRQWRQGEVLEIEPSAGEELGAVLNGRFELRCGDECHVLTAGSGVLVPPGEAYRWQLLSEEGTLYRVTCPVPPAAVSS